MLKFFQQITITFSMVSLKTDNLRTKISRLLPQYCYKQSNK